MIWIILAAIATGVVLGFTWYYCMPLFGIIIICLLLVALYFVATEEVEIDEDIYLQEVQQGVQEEVREMLCKSRRKHKVKYIENALAAYQELYGKDDFYQEIWHEVYEEFYKEKEKEE